MENELVSIVIACYNAESYIDVCLESLVDLSYKNIEIIICDDASTDKSWSLLKKWQERDSRIILLQNDHNMFPATTRNSCIDIARGKYLLFQDIDDISAPNRIDVLLSTLKTHKVDFVSSSMATVDDYGNIDNDHLWKHKKCPSKYDFLWNQPFNHPASLFVTKVIKEVNGYRVAKETRRGEDYDLFMRLYAKGAKGMNVEEPLYIYRLNTGTYTRRTFSSRIDECRIRYKGFKELNLLLIGFPMVIKPIVVHIIKKMLRIN